MITTQKLGTWIAITVLTVVFAPQAWANGGPGGAVVASAVSATSAKPAVAKSSKTTPAGAATTSNGQMPDDLKNALQMPAGAERTKVVNTAAMNWEKSDPKAACEWVIFVAKGGDQAPLKGMVFDWGARDGTSAVAWMMGHDPKAVKAQIHTLHYFVTAWAGPDPQAAAAWAEKQPKGDLRKNAFNSVGEGWARSKDTVGSAAWAAKLTDDDDRHVAVNIVAGIWSGSVNRNPEPVTAWAEKLPPADIKIAALQIVPAWKDAAKAKAWVEKLSLPAADKTEILSKIK